MKQPYWTIKQLENHYLTKTATDGGSMFRTCWLRALGAGQVGLRRSPERSGSAPVLYRKYHHVFSVFFCGKTSFRSFRVRWFSFLYSLVLFVVSLVKLRCSFVIWMTLETDRGDAGTLET